MQESIKIGLFGGSFDPPHRIHNAIVRKFIEQFNLSKCLIMPAYVSPFKTLSAELESGIHRLTMCSLCFANIKNIIVSDYEISKGSVSYTIDTVRYLLEENLGSELFMLIGSDQAAEFDKWKSPEELLSLCNLVIAERAGSTQKEKRTIAQIFSHYNYQPQWLSHSPADLSSTAVREAIKKGIPIDDLVMPQVAEYIKSNGLYL